MAHASWLLPCLVLLDALSAWSFGACGGDEPPTQAGAGSAGAGVGGSVGASGMAGNGTPMSGMGGGGAGGLGGGTCSEDANCSSTGEGSLCIKSACTASKATCDFTAVVVVDKAFSGSLEGTPPGACYVRTLDEALVTLAPGATTRLAVYAERASAKLPLDVTGLIFEGHGPTTGQPVALTVTSTGGGTPLVRLGEGSVVRGFALSGTGAQKGFGIKAGKARLEGPLELRGLSPALSVESDSSDENTATVRVVGTPAAPVRLSGNARGVYVGQTAGLEMTGEGGESLVVEKTSAGAGVLIDKGQLDKGELKMTGVLVRENGTGGLEVRESRKATVSGSTFSGNNAGLTFEGQDISATISNNTFTENGTSISFRGQGISATVSNNTFVLTSTSIMFSGTVGDLFSAFQDVTLAGNNFSNALPLQSGTGVAICGSSLNGDGTTLTLGPGNTLPSSVQPSPATCEFIESHQVGSCNSGADIGFQGMIKRFSLNCVP